MNTNKHKLFFYNPSVFSVNPVAYKNIYTFLCG